jgi:hypothetical protein
MKEESLGVVHKKETNGGGKLKDVTNIAIVGV